MNLKEAIEQIVVLFEYRAPGPHALEIIKRVNATYAYKRHVPLSELTKPADLVCAWCNLAPTKSRGRKYCGKDCSESALMYLYPQFAASKMYRLIVLQDFACRACGVIDEEWFLKRMEHYKAKQRRVLEEYKKYGWAVDKNETEKAFLFQFGDCTGDRWQVDHIVPVHKGGAGVGMENLQVLCTPCHKLKTAKDLGGKRCQRSS